MVETRKLAAILCSDVVGYSRLAGADEDRILARLRALRSDLIDPTIAVHNGRVVKRTGDGSIVEFRSVVDAVRCAIEVQTAMVDRNAGVPKDRRIVFRIGIHLGDVVEEIDGDLMGDGVNIAARLEGIAAPAAVPELARLALTYKPSIAVLPFQNISDDPSQESRRSNRSPPNDHGGPHNRRKAAIPNRCLGLAVPAGPSSTRPRSESEYGRRGLADSLGHG